MLNPESDFFLGVIALPSEEASYLNKHLSEGSVNHGVRSRPVRLPQAIRIKAKLLDLVEDVRMIGVLFEERS